MILLLQFSITCLSLPMTILICTIRLEHKVVLKFNKTWLGFPSVDLFGYHIIAGTYDMSTSCKASIQDIPMPRDKLEMQRYDFSVLVTGNDNGSKNGRKQ